MTLSVKLLAGMAKEDIVSEPCNNLKLMRLASLVKNKIYELKAELNCNDKSGIIEVMHLEILQADKNQTKRGMFLECIKNVPCAIHLPYGRWQFAQPRQIKGEHAQKMMERIILEFDLELEKKYTREKIYHNGTRLAGDSICIWAIRRVGQNLLEKAVYKGETEYMDAIHAHRGWEALFT